MSKEIFIKLLLSDICHSDEKSDWLPQASP